LWKAQFQCRLHKTTAAAVCHKPHVTNPHVARLFLEDKFYYRPFIYSLVSQLFWIFHVFSLPVSYIFYYPMWFKCFSNLIPSNFMKIVVAVASRRLVNPYYRAVSWLFFRLQVYGGGEEKNSCSVGPLRQS
jgi:cellulose synthase/poly-beta-1,6-N-acetylglucosamine synthase-like glycosyltransferase